MSRQIQEAYARYTLGQMIIDELQRVFDGPVPSDHPALKIEEQGEAYRHEAAWAAATCNAQDSNDILLKTLILRSYSEDDPSDAVSALLHSMCSDITRLLADDDDAFDQDTDFPIGALKVKDGAPPSQV